jgi:hypothetical protein
VDQFNTVQDQFEDTQPMSATLKQYYAPIVVMPATIEDDFSRHHDNGRIGLQQALPARLALVLSFGISNRRHDEIATRRRLDYARRCR